MRRGICRTTNNPVADYTEHLVTNALGLKLAAKSTKGFDATDSGHKRYEIKGRRRGSHRERVTRLSAIRDLDKQHFDYLVAVLFHPDYTVFRACQIPYAAVLDLAGFYEHTRSSTVTLTDSVWRDPRVTDLTQNLQSAEARLNALS
jgi:hypothetical protein